ncbi:hypothetical protein PG994_005145 [Apiospora phragmitis]|uniref:Uncharacterized protein n=1 Tax=Apiospora phragmitis TaxID=2905665 RepID=A0ABR1VSL7_9PEZI
MGHSSGSKMSSTSDKKKSKDHKSRVNDWLQEDPREDPWSSVNTYYGKDSSSSSGHGDKKHKSGSKK